jgi:hypothetical protein
MGTWGRSGAVGGGATASRGRLLALALTCCLLPAACTQPACPAGFSGRGPDGGACVACASGTYRPGGTHYNLARACGADGLQPCASQQSSTDAGQAAARAVDGDNSTDIAAGSCTHTSGAESSPWWMVDLGQVRAVSAVKIWGRSDCCSERLQGFDVRIGSSASSYSAATVCFTGGTAPQASPSCGARPYDGTWCGQQGSKFYTIEDCDGDGIVDHVCRDDQGQIGVIQSSNQCADSWPGGVCSAVPGQASQASPYTAQVDCARSGQYLYIGLPDSSDALTLCEVEVYEACYACPALSTSPANATNCTCNAGSSGPDGGACTPCSSGTYKTVSGSEACTSCPAGTYQGVAGSSQCLMCSQGTYSETGSAACSACPSHSFSGFGSTSVSNCTCNLGYSGPDGGACTACVAGKYKAVNGTALCSLCSRGKYSGDSAAISEVTCRECPSNADSHEGTNSTLGCICNFGYTGPNGDNCAACAPGKYKNFTGSAQCLQCPSNSASGLGSKYSINCTCNLGYTGPDGGVCSACGAGKYKDVRGTASCMLCARGKYSTTTGESSEVACLDCPSNTVSGHGSVSTSDCICRVGFTGPAGAACTECGEHHYKTVNGSSPCLLCPPRSHTDGLTGQSACVCYSESYGSDTLPLVCHRCPLNAICLEDTTCALRAPAHVSQDGSIFRFLCPGGRPIIGNWTRNSSTGAYELVSCPSGYQLLSAHDMASPEKQECAPGIWTKASACPYGHEVSALQTGREPFKKCAECGRRKECVSPPCGPSSCTYCAPGFYKNTVGTYSCLQCPENSYREGIHIEGCGCAPGFYGSYGNCSVCPENHYCPGSGQVLPCPEGGISTSGSKLLTNCTCAAGHYLSVPADHDWEQTRQNVFMDFFNVSVVGGAGSSTCTSQCVDVQCAPCGFGRFSAGGTTTCTSCPLSSTTVSLTSASVSECVCESGFYLQGSECMLCPVHMSSPAGSVQITDCQCVPGYTGPHGDSCEACEVGKYKPLSGSSLCDLCEPGKYMDELAATTCKACPLLTTSLQGQAHVNNCSCIAGYTGPSGLAQCRQCGFGKYKDSFGSFGCHPCPAGTYSDERGNTNVSFCLSCPPKMSSPPGSISNAVCICAEGFTGLNGDECYPCMLGTYKNVRGSSPCIPCALGKYSNSNASTACISCAAGKYLDQIGATSDSCMSCPAATYSDILGATTEDNCEKCGAGTFSDKIGANSSIDCRPCPFGTYSENKGTTVCSDCPAGKYGGLEGAMSQGITELFLLRTQRTRLGLDMAYHTLSSLPNAFLSCVMGLSANFSDLVCLLLGRSLFGVSSGYV